MIKVIEKEMLDDEFIIKPFISNINLNDNIYFTKDNIYYFGNYKNNELKNIKQKLIKNKRNIIRAIEKGIRFIVCGNSVELFNNDFKADGFNLYTLYNPSSFKRRLNHLIIKKDKYKSKIKIVSNLEGGICAVNFKYKNFLCVSKENKLDELIKKVKQKDLSV